MAGVLESLRREKPDLDLVLTQVDDRFDTGMRRSHRRRRRARAPHP